MGERGASVSAVVRDDLCDERGEGTGLLGESYDDEEGAGCRCGDSDAADDEDDGTVGDGNDERRVVGMCAKVLELVAIVAVSMSVFLWMFSTRCCCCCCCCCCCNCFC